MSGTPHCNQVVSETGSYSQVHPSAELGTPLGAEQALHLYMPAHPPAAVALSACVDAGYRAATPLRGKTMQLPAALLGNSGTAGLLWQRKTDYTPAQIALQVFVRKR